MKKSQNRLMNFFEIPFAPGADLRFALLIDLVNSSIVRGESKSIFSASDNFAFCINKSFSPLSFVAVFGSGIRDPEYEIRGSGSEIRDPRSEIRDPGWTEIRIRDKHPGSATLFLWLCGFAFLLLRSLIDGFLKDAHCELQLIPSVIHR